MRKYIKGMLALCLGIIIAIGSTDLSFAAKEDSKIKVGYYSLQHYFEKDNAGVYTGYIYDYLQEIAQFTNKEYEYVPIAYSNSTALLQDGSIDLLVGLQTSKKDETLSYIDREDIFFATRMEDSLQEELEAALAQIDEQYPYLESDLANQYTNYTVHSKPDYSDEEIAYLTSYPSVQVVFSPIWNPIEFEDEESGEFKGIAADVLERIEADTGLDFSYVSEEDATMNADTVVIYPAMVHDYKQAAEHQVYLTRPYLKSSIVVLEKRKNQGEIEHVALPQDYFTNHVMSELLANEQITEKQITYYDTFEDCIRAVNSGKADATYVNEYVANYYLSNSEFWNLYAVQSTGVTENLAIAISMNANPALLGILNKSLLSISDENMESIILSNMAPTEKITLRAIAYSQPIFLIASISGVFLLVLVSILSIFAYRAKKQRAIKHILQTDSLTGLYNRGATVDKINKLMLQDVAQKGVYCTLIMIDLDNFKQVNDTYGHMEGDVLLQAVAQVLKSCMVMKAVVGRMGGDEFVVYLSGRTSMSEIKEQSIQLCTKVRQLSTQKDEWKNISASIGVVATLNHKITWENLYQTADAALYRAKGDGKNNVCIDIQGEDGKAQAN